jgi:hypothetical protein
LVCVSKKSENKDKNNEENEENIKNKKWLYQLVEFDLTPIWEK